MAMTGASSGSAASAGGSGTGGSSSSGSGVPGNDAIRWDLQAAYAGAFWALFLAAFAVPLMMAACCGARASRGVTAAGEWARVMSGLLLTGAFCVLPIVISIPFGWDGASDAAGHAAAAAPSIVYAFAVLMSAFSRRAPEPESDLSLDERSRAPMALSDSAGGARGRSTAGRSTATVRESQSLVCRASQCSCRPVGRTRFGCATRWLSAVFDHRIFLDHAYVLFGGLSGFLAHGYQLVKPVPNRSNAEIFHTTSTGILVIIGVLGVCALHSRAVRARVETQRLMMPMSSILTGLVFLGHHQPSEFALTVHHNLSYLMLLAGVARFLAYTRPRLLFWAAWIILWGAHMFSAGAYHTGLGLAATGLSAMNVSLLAGAMALAECAFCAAWAVTLNKLLGDGPAPDDLGFVQTEQVSARGQPGQYSMVALGNTSGGEEAEESAL